MENKLCLHHRQSGRTTQQLTTLPKGTIFIIHHESARKYVEDLCKKLGREDIIVQPLTWLCDERWRGSEFPGAAIDHYARELMGDEHQIAWERFQSRIRDGQRQSSLPEVSK